MDNSSKNKILSVSQINSYIRHSLEKDFASIWIKGEISNFVAHGSGHWYFSLKEADSQIKSVMFRGHNQKLSFRPENGSEVLIHGQVSVYAPRGVYQILCNKMELLGDGLLQKKFEELKNKLKEEGLFDSDKKLPIPQYPQHIAVITSPTGAAIRDVLQILRRRSGALKVTLIPALVQGAEAPRSLIQALKQAEKIPTLDALIIGRGGGSMEDLAGFNDEELARTIFQMQIPVISAVGHEIDFTICDFVSDLRAPTPSTAAELIVKNREDLLERIATQKKQLIQHMKLQFKFFKEKVRGLKNQLISPEKFLQDRSLRVDDLSMGLTRSIRQILQREKVNLKNLNQLLKSLSPTKIMERGFCLALKEDGKIVTDSKQLKIQDQVSLEFFKGGAQALITSKESN